MKGSFEYVITFEDDSDEFYEGQDITVIFEDILLLPPEPDVGIMSDYIEDYDWSVYDSGDIPIPIARDYASRYIEEYREEIESEMLDHIRS